MPYKSKIKTGFLNEPDHRLEEIAGSVLKGMRNNPAFPDPPVTMADLEALLNGFSAALAAQKMGGKTVTIDKNTKREQLIQMLRELGAYVQMAAQNDEAALLTSGFEAASTTHAMTELTKPTDVQLKNGNSGQLLMKIDPVANAHSYEIQYAVVTADGTQGDWQSGGDYTNSRAIQISGLTPGTVYGVRIRAIGGTTGYSDWSDATSHRCL